MQAHRFHIPAPDETPVIDGTHVGYLKRPELRRLLTARGYDIAPDAEKTLMLDLITRDERVRAVDQGSEPRRNVGGDYEKAQLSTQYWEDREVLKQYRKAKGGKRDAG